MKRLLYHLLICLIVLYLTGCDLLLPKVTSCYDRTRTFYESNVSLLRDCVQECQGISAKSPGCGYVVRKLDTGILEMTQNYSDGASPKSNLNSESLSKVLDVSWISLVTFDADCVAFQIDTLGSAERMLVFLPSQNPYSFYCKTDQWTQSQWYPVVEDGETVYREENGDNTVFFKKIGSEFYYVELHY